GIGPRIELRQRRRCRAESGYDRAIQWRKSEDASDSRTAKAKHDLPFDLLVVSVQRKSPPTRNIHARRFKSLFSHSMFTYCSVPCKKIRQAAKANGQTRIKTLILLY